MDTSAKPLQFASVLERIKSFQQSKLAADTSSVKDPADKGTVGIPKDPENTPAKENMPASADNTVSNEGKKLEDKQLKPTSTGNNVPSTSDGNAKENVSSPTDSLSKIAKRVSSVVEHLKQSGSLDVKDKDEKKVEKPSTDKIEGAPAQSSNKDVVAKAPAAKTEKEAANDQIASDISPEALMKLASVIVSTEGGLEAVEPVLMKAAGIEAARQIMSQAVDSYTDFVQKQAALEEKLASEYIIESEEDAAFAEFFKAASDKDKEQIVKFAKVHGQALDNISNSMLKQAYMQGAEDAAAMEDAGGEQLPGAEGPATLEQIAQLLETMVASGEIDEQTAMGILQQLAEGQGGEEGGGAATAGAEAAPEEAAAAAAAGGAGEEFKQASELCLKLINSVKK